jgi:hypothetical protein
MSNFMTVGEGGEELPPIRYRILDSAEKGRVIF